MRLHFPYFLFTFKVGKARREEIVNRELDFLEELARIIGCGCAFLIGHAEIVNRNHHLNRSLNLNDGEQADSYSNSLVGTVTAEIAVELLNYLGREHDGRIVDVALTYSAS